MSRISRRFLAGGSVLFVAAVVMLFDSRDAPPQKPEASAGETAQPSPRSPTAAGERTPRLTRISPPADGLPVLPAPVVSPHSLGSAENQEWAEQRITELQELEWFDDFASLGKILAELRNPDPEIRKAALQAVKNSGSRDAIPYLVKAASEAREPEEPQEIRKVIEYLELPSAAEETESDEE